MPFTPFHMGAGLALKAMAGRHFSVLTFGMAQVAMDIEPLVGMLRGAAVLHGPRTPTWVPCPLRWPRLRWRRGFAARCCGAGTARYNTTALHGCTRTSCGGHAQCCSAPWQAPGRMWGWIA